MDDGPRSLVSSRASHRCEYCRLHEDDDAYSFHVEHIVAKKHGVGDETENLAFACHQCNLHKGPNLSGIDPDTGATVELFHPRRDSWTEYFTFQGAHIVGLTARGRATVRVLNMNDPDRIRVRAELGFPDKGH